MIILEPDRALASHLAVAVRRHQEDLRRAGLPAPPGLAEFFEMVHKRARAGHSGTGIDTALDAVNHRQQPLLLTNAEAAALLNVSLRTVSRMIADDSLPVTRVTGAPRIRRVNVERLARLVSSPEGTE